MTITELKTTLGNPESLPAAKERATALLALYSASVGYALKNGGTEYAEWSGNFDVWLYENDSIETIAAAEKDLLRCAGTA